MTSLAEVTMECSRAIEVTWSLPTLLWMLVKRYGLRLVHVMHEIILFPC